MNDDRAIKEFFESNKQEFNDKEFSRSVMKKIPSRGGVLPYIVIALSFLVGLGLFVFMGGLSMMWQGMEVVNRALLSQEPLQPEVIYFALFGVIYLVTVSIAAYKAYDAV